MSGELLVIATVASVIAGSPTGSISVRREAPGQCYLARAVGPEVGQFDVGAPREAPGAREVWCVDHDE